ncbi:MAG: haloacid dehalogenase-like hydrolase [Firmicutes bacterium]|nr:haloacid dehalogenase-like hydrolase [Bacillota bacterium]
MQEPMFKRYGIKGSDFWRELDEIYHKYQSANLRVNRETLYLNHILTCVRQGIFEGLNNDLLFEFGGQLEFYNGIPELFEEIEMVLMDPRFRKYGISVEHYVVSTGLAQIIRGSKIAGYVKEIWGCEYIETPIKSQLIIKEYPGEEPDSLKLISQIGYSIDNTTKTRAIYEINKGVKIHPEIDINSSIAKENRRIPFENMIYIADGPSDVPAFSIVKHYGGRTYAVYPRGNRAAFKQVDQLRKDDRIDAYGEADYSEGTTTNLWIIEQTCQIAEQICRKKEYAIKRSASPPPIHLND